MSNYLSVTDGGIQTADMIGQVVALRPYDFDRTLETSEGPSQATFCEVLVLDEQTGFARSLGTGPIFWSIVRSQLRAATAGREWIVGRLEQDSKGRKAYKLTPIGAEAESAISRAISSHESGTGNRESGRGRQDGGGGRQDGGGLEPPITEPADYDDLG